MKRLIFLITWALCAYISTFAQDKIAIYVVGNASDSYKKVVASALTQAVNNDGHYKAVERTGDFIGALGSEVSYQNSGAVSQYQIVELGKQFGAQYVFVVDLNDVLGELYASSRIINVQENSVAAASDESSKISTMEQLRALSTKIASSTLAKLPYNIQKKKNAERFQYLRKEAEKYYLAPISNAKELCESYLTSYTTTKIEVQSYIRTCKELGRKIDYPIYFNVEAVSFSDYGKKKEGLCMARYKASCLKESGNVTSIYFNVVVGSRGYPINSGQQILGYHLCRSPHYGK